LCVFVCVCVCVSVVKKAREKEEEMELLPQTMVYTISFGPAGGSQGKKSGAAGFLPYIFF
jgi:hypothetical protein